MGTIRAPARQNGLGHGQTAGDAAPFRHVGLNIGKRPGRDGGVEILHTHKIFPGGERNAALRRQPRPVARRRIGAQGFFQPVQPQVPRPLGKFQGRLQVPGLVGVGKQALARLQGCLQGLDARDVLRRVEADLDLEIAEPGGAEFGHHVGSDADMDAAGIGGHAIHRVPGDEVAQGPAGGARRQIPQRHVDPGNNLGIGPRFPSLQHPHAGFLPHQGIGLGGRGQVAPGQQRRQFIHGHAHSVFGAAAGEIAPDFPESKGAVGAFNPQEHGRAITHDTERGFHGALDRDTQRPDVDAAKTQRAGGKRPRRRWRGKIVQCHEISFSDRHP